MLKHKQARTFYENVKIDIIKSAYKYEKYIAIPNFHLSFQRSGLMWFTTTNTSLENYIKFWQRTSKETGINQISKDNIKEYYSYLVAEKIIDSNNSDFENKILSKGYQKFNICPGMYLGYSWSIDEATKMDNASGDFAKDVMKKIETIWSFYK